MKTLFEEIGAANLERLVGEFYDRVQRDERISHLFKTDMNVVRDKQYKFLTQFLGGPQLYSAEYGHPRMRMRHLPHTIGIAERDAWLENMKAAVSSLDMPDELKQRLYNVFPQIAAHMVNS